MKPILKPKNIFFLAVILLLLSNGFLALAQESRIDRNILFRIRQSAIKPYEKMADDIIIKQFSASFLLFNP